MKHPHLYMGAFEGWMKGKLTLAWVAAISSMIASGAQASTVGAVAASDSGWISALGVANAGGFNGGVNNVFAGYEYSSLGPINDWFQFTLPSTPILAATLEIWNYALDHTIDPDAVYNLYAATSFTFSGLASGESLGSVTLGAADDGVSHYVAITLNSAGLSFLNSNLGGVVDFGGSVTTSFYVDPSTCVECVEIFGYNDNPLTILALPEPSTWTMMAIGFVGLGYTGYRRARAGHAGLAA
jgi:hypothetical protein